MDDLCLFYILYQDLNHQINVYNLEGRSNIYGVSSFPATENPTMTTFIEP